VQRQDQHDAGDLMQERDKVTSDEMIGKNYGHFCKTLRDGLFKRGQFTTEKPVGGEK